MPAGYKPGCNAARQPAASADAAVSGLGLGRWELARQLGVDPTSSLGGQRPGPVQLLRQPPRIVERIAADLERPEKRKAAVGQEPLRGQEAETSVNRNLRRDVGECRLHDGYLLRKAL